MIVVTAAVIRKNDKILIAQREKLIFLERLEIAK